MDDAGLVSAGRIGLNSNSIFIVEGTKVLTLLLNTVEHFRVSFFIFGWTRTVF